MLILCAAAVLFAFLLSPVPGDPLPTDTGNGDALQRAVPTDETCTYTVMLNGVALGRAQLRLEPANWAGRACLRAAWAVRSLEGIGAVWNARASGVTLVDRESLTALTADVSSTTPERTKRTFVHFPPAGGHANLIIDRTDKEGTRRKRLPVADAMDPLSLLLRLRARAVGKGPIELLSGDDLLRVAVHRQGTARIQVPAGRFEATAYTISGEKIDPDEPDEPPERLPAITAWVATDDGRLIKLSGGFMLGRAEVVLTECTGPGQ